MVKEFIPACSYILLLIGLLLSVWFNRSRSFFMLLAITLVQFFLIDFKPVNVPHEQYLRYVDETIAVLLPVNLMIFLFIKERGIFTLWGAQRFLIILLQMLFISSSLLYHNEELMKGIEVTILPWEMRSYTPLPQLSMLCFLGAFLLLAWRQQNSRTHVDKAFLGVSPLLILALHFKEDSLAAHLCMIASALLFIIALIQDSYRMAYLDELTGLPARRALKEELMKLSGKYAIAMLDVDHFKKFNDTYGHEVGDEVLKLVASCLKNVKGGGKAFRYGGEEFTILFPNKQTNEALPHLEELREAVANTGLTRDAAGNEKTSQRKRGCSNRTLHVTISIGVAEKSEKYKTADEVISAADKALYRAKDKGRNCVSK